MKFRKKPVTIDAWQFRAGEQEADLAPYVRDKTIRYTDENTQLLISTLEGVMIASPGDWIIKGVAGELYPCKDAIFKATYEPVEDS